MGGILQPSDVQCIYMITYKINILLLFTFKINPCIILRAGTSIGLILKNVPKTYFHMIF